MPKVEDMNYSTLASVDLSHGVTQGSGKIMADAKVIPRSTLRNSRRTTGDAYRQGHELLTPASEDPCQGEIPKV